MCVILCYCIIYGKYLIKYFTSASSIIPSGHVYIIETCLNLQFYSAQMTKYLRRKRTLKNSIFNRGAFNISFAVIFHCLTTVRSLYFRKAG